jgi:intracellular septation protein A
MKNLLNAGRLLVLDLASTFVFLILYVLTRNVVVAVVLGMALGAAQIGLRLARKSPIDTMQWLSLSVVLGLGSATLITADPRFVMLKPSLVYAIVGLVMLKPGWMNRYMPPIVLELMPDVVRRFGLLWAGLMLFSGALNLIVALSLGVEAWASFMLVYGIVSKVGLFLVQYAVMRFIAGRRRRRMLAGGPAAL